MPQVGRILVVLSCVAAVLVTGQVVGATSSNPPYVHVAHGQFAGRFWSLAIAGRQGRRCYRLTLHSTSVQGIGVTCRADRRPPYDWTRLEGISDLNGSATVELDVTKKRVHSMRLRIRHPRSGIKAGWVRVATHRLTFAEAREAHVKRNFRFAVLHSRGNLCVTKVVLFDGSGDLIDRSSVPCEY
jgi:hypothetical protein